MQPATLKKFFQDVVKLLEDHRVRFALTGGFVASIYRDEPRATHDLDFLLFAEESPEQQAHELLKKLKFHPRVVRQADLEGGPMFAIKNQLSPVCIVVGREESLIGVDFLLPTLMWVTEAVERAQHNQIDFGFGGVPCVRIEDFIISKLISYNNQKTRFKDLDDLQSVFQKKQEIDFVYLKTRIAKYNLKIPEVLKDSVPVELRKLIRK